MERRVHFLFMGAAWSVSETGFRFLSEKADFDEPIDLELTDAREIKRARPGTRPLIGKNIRNEIPGR